MVSVQSLRMTTAVESPSAPQSRFPNDPSCRDLPLLQRRPIDFSYVPPESNVKCTVIHLFADKGRVSCGNIYLEKASEKGFSTCRAKDWAKDRESCDSRPLVKRWRLHVTPIQVRAALWRDKQTVS
eukprot:6211364-Pleurochrysis_carterae.AAC.2